MNFSPRLHVGCGNERLNEWVNVDLRIQPGTTDLVADIARGLPVERASAVYCEHVLEHLDCVGAIDFLHSCHEVLEDRAWLRISTPNLDWVWRSHYSLERGREDKALSAVNLNRAFRGWGHQFLWNRELLEIALEACGFDSIQFAAHGESSRELFRGIERHEEYDDLGNLHHVIVCEAQKGSPNPTRLAWLREMIEFHYLRHLAPSLPHGPSTE